MFEIMVQGRRGASVMVLLVSVGLLFLYNWIEEAKLTAHVAPKVGWCRIDGVIAAKKISYDEMLVLSEQTGLGVDVIEMLLECGEQQKLLDIQDIYFAPVEIREVRTTPITISEWIVADGSGKTHGMPLVDIQDGDILITKNSRFLGWRNGHAGLVVDAEKGLVLEALMLGSDSQLCKISKWESYPSFVVLRLKEGVEMPEGSVEEPAWQIEEKMSARLAAQVADYASENLVGIEYHLLTEPKSQMGASWPAGTASVPEMGEGIEVTLQEAVVPTGTHCAHLVWYAYLQAGIDLDSDGGFFVTPDDILNSPYLEVVQEYGY